MTFRAEFAYFLTKSGRVKLSIAKYLEQRLRSKWQSDVFPKIGKRTRKPGLFISMTTWKPRLDVIPLTLLTLAHQSILPERIVVWITEEDHKQTSEKLRFGFERFGVEFRLSENLGPHKKWFHTREFGNDATVVLADDDVFYPKNWLKQLADEFATSRSYLGNRCHKIACRDSKLAPYSEWHHECREYGRASHDLFATGCGGVAFQPGWIPDPFWDWGLIEKLCPKADDIWLKAAMLAADIKVRKSQRFMPIHGPEAAVASGLENINVHDDYNTHQMRDVINHFSLEKLLTDGAPWRTH